MPKCDFICKNCKEVSGSDRDGYPTAKYKCARCGDLCRDCIKITWLSKKRYCRKCDGGVLLYDYNAKNKRWEKA
jgi:hypothetical protein